MCIATSGHYIGSNPLVLLLLTSGLSEIGFICVCACVYVHMCVYVHCAYVCLCGDGGACINQEHGRTSHGAS